MGLEEELLVLERYKRRRRSMANLRLNA